MTHDSVDSETEKELDALIKLFPKEGSTLPTEKMEQKEARAILGYITYLETVTTQFRTQSNSASKEQAMKKEYNQHDLDIGLIKLVGMAAGLHSNQKEE